jgi:hypothetical protein
VELTIGKPKLESSRMRPVAFLYRSLIQDIVNHTVQPNGLFTGKRRVEDSAGSRFLRTTAFRAVWVGVQGKPWGDGIRHVGPVWAGKLQVL